MADEQSVPYWERLKVGSQEMKKEYIDPIRSAVVYLICVTVSITLLPYVPPTAMALLVLLTCLSHYVIPTERRNISMVYAGVIALVLSMSFFVNTDITAKVCQSGFPTLLSHNATPPSIKPLGDFMSHLCISLKNHCAETNPTFITVTVTANPITVTAIETTRTTTTVTATPEPLTLTSTTITTEATKIMTEKLADQPPMSPPSIEETDLQSFQTKLVEVIQYTLFLRGAEPWVVDTVKEFVQHLKNGDFATAASFAIFPQRRAMALQNDAESVDKNSVSPEHGKSGDLTDIAAKQQDSFQRDGSGPVAEHDESIAPTETTTGISPASPSKGEVGEQ